MSDIEQIRGRARKALMRRRLLGLRDSLIPITAHVGSLITILAAWFMRTGQFHFRTDEWLDWLVLGVLIFVAMSGIRLIISSVSVPTRITVSRSELVDLIAASRLDADVSIVNFAGDLSWLTDDVELSKAIRLEKPTVSMAIYYDRSRTPPELAELLDEYPKMRIDLIPYPKGVTPSLRCMLIDKEDPKNRRMYVYTRVPSTTLGQPRSEHQFAWQQVGPTEHAGIEAALDLVNAILVLRDKPLLIGISGTNNVGKTSIVTRASELIGRGYSVVTIGDEFRVAARGSTKDDAYTTLCSQLIRLQETHGDVCIIDRTFADNLCFLRLRGGKTEKAYTALAPRVAELIRSFDLTFDVKRSVETYTERTKYVSASDRRKVRQYLDEFFAHANVQPIPLTTDIDKFEESVEKAAQKVAEEARKLLSLRRTSR